LRKLNLGCGDKILPGSINVDCCREPALHEPDVVCELHQLTPFESDSVDEVLAAQPSCLRFASAMLLARLPCRCAAHHLTHRLFLR
jgi:hypothetical protein